MDYGGREIGHGMHEVVFCVMRDLMGGRQAQGWVDIELGVCVQGVANPAHP